MIFIVFSKLLLRFFKSSSCHCSQKVLDGWSPKDERKMHTKSWPLITQRAIGIVNSSRPNLLKSELRCKLRWRIRKEAGKRSLAPLAWEDVWSLLPSLGCSHSGLAMAWSGELPPLLDWFYLSSRNHLVLTFRSFSYYLKRILEDVGITNNKTVNQINVANTCWGLLNGTLMPFIVYRFKRRTIYLACTISLLCVYTS